jgi:signal transduction histidine kinase
MLLECDLAGRVLWMSAPTRATLGPIETLLEALPRWRMAASDGSSLELAFVRLFEMGGSVLIGIRPAPPVGDAVHEYEMELRRLQGKMMLHYFRLLKAEQRLSGRVKRSPNGGRTLRQIDRERQRLGRELHTNIGQQLSAIRLQTEVISAQLPGPNPEVERALDRILTLTADALEQVRSISRRLHPPEWQRLTLEDALRQFWSLSGIPERFQATLRLDPLPLEPGLEAKILLYRTAQEAASNLVRHSQATRVEAALTARDGCLVLSFEDNGVGFDARMLLTAPASIGRGIGLLSIREQAEGLGGKFVVESGPEGTKLEVSVPFAQADS